MDTLRFTAETAKAVNRAASASPLSQKAIAELAGIPRTTFIRKLRGSHPFNVAELAGIALALDVPVTELFGGDAVQEAGR
jgi:transcriptional regulator with XRE-family HTH domain